MAKATVSRVSATDIPVRRRGVLPVAVVGIPNSGKSTLFNRLTGLKQKTGNYPGVTVERHTGTMTVDGTTLELVDLPGVYALSAASLEERIAVDVILGRMEDVEAPQGILAVVSATQLYQGLYLLQQLLDLKLPLVVALTQVDAAEAAGIRIDVEALSRRLGGVRVCPVIAPTGKGIAELKQAIAGIENLPLPDVDHGWPELRQTAEGLIANGAADFSPIVVERAIVDDDSPMATEVAGALADSHSPDGATALEAARAALSPNDHPLAEEARQRYRIAREIYADVQESAPAIASLSARIAAWFNRPLPGTLGLFVVMAIVFQAVFAWATPAMDAIEAGAGAVSAWVSATLPSGVVSRFIAEGVIDGVGSVIVFLPQILVLFLFIIVLEDSGYLARAAYLMDRAMRSVGLSGQSVIPMISSFACAVPSIMATRVIPNRRDRIATILAAPFMTCSARLPVYALLIAAFVPRQDVGFLNLQGLVLFGLYLLGIVGGLLTALLLRQTALKGGESGFALVLPEFRKPDWRTVLLQLLARARAFLYRAGTVIFVVVVVVWVLSNYPDSDLSGLGFDADRATAEQTLSGDALDERLAQIDNEVAAAKLEQSYLGRMGKVIEPVFRPLGWDWKVSAAVLASFPAREVVVAVLGTIYAVGDEADEALLSERLREERSPDGGITYTLPMVIGLMIFYAFCLQCAATVAVIRRETNSLRWPAFAWTYMTAIGYLGALLAYQVGTALS